MSVVRLSETPTATRTPLAGRHRGPKLTVPS